MDDQRFLETWEIHNRITLYLLEAIEPPTLVSLSASKGRTVGEQFAHIHNVRLMWLKSAAPDLLAGLGKIEKGQAIDKKLLRKGLTDSGSAIRSLLDSEFAEWRQSEGIQAARSRLSGLSDFTRIAAPRAIILSLKQAGKVLDKKILYGIWEWGVR